MRIKFFWLALFVSLVLPLAAQVRPAAERSGTGITFWVGASVSTFNPDWGCANSSPFSCWEHHLVGIGPYLDTNFFLLGRIGLEGEEHLMFLNGPATLDENSYLGGPRVRLFHHHAVNITGKFLLGEASLDVPPQKLGRGTYFAYAPGVAVDYRVASHVSARVEYEYQRWPGYKCNLCTGGGVGGLTPSGFNFGISYKIPSSVYGIAPN